MAGASNYAAGDTVIFARSYKTLGVEKGDVEVYRSEGMEPVSGTLVRGALSAVVTLAATEIC